MSKPTVYIAGPITDMNFGQANDWRAYVKEELAKYNITGISPLRCEPIRGETYTTGNPDPRFGTAKAIGSKNVYDLKNCNMTIAYIPTPPEGLKHSWGTIAELSWAYILGNPAILVSDDPAVRDHPVLKATAGWIVEDLDDAVDICAGILGDYT
jgi:nucleoside 2-deoxyribosyltransferase